MGTLVNFPTVTQLRGGRVQVFLGLALKASSPPGAFLPPPSIAHPAPNVTAGVTCLKPRSDPITALHEIPGGSSVPRGYAQATCLPPHRALVTPPDLCSAVSASQALPCPLPGALCPTAHLSTPVSSLLEASGSAISHTLPCRYLAVTPPQSQGWESSV